MSLVVIETAELKALIADAVSCALRDALPKPVASPELVSGAHMAKLLSVSRATLHRMRVAGCPAIKLGDSYKFQPGAVLAWLKSRENAAS